MSSILDLAIGISLADHVSSGINSIIGHFGLLRNASAEAQAQMDKFKTMGWIGASIGAIGVAGVHELDKLAQKAGEVKMQLIQLGGVYGLDVDDSKLKEVDQLAQDMSQRTIFSKKENIGIDLELAHAGISQEALKKVVPEATYLAEVEVGMGKSSGAQHTAYNFARMSEDAGITNDTDRMSKFADDMYRVINVTHANSESLGEAFKYSMPVVKNLGWTEQDNLIATAMATRAGVEGSMAGTHIKDFAERINPYKYLGAASGQKQLNAMAEAGLLDGVVTQTTKGGKEKIVGFETAALLKDKDHLKSYAEMIDVLAEKHESFLKKGSGTDWVGQTSKEDLDKLQAISKQMTGKELSGGNLQWAALMNHIFGEQGQDFAIISSHKDMFDKLKQQMDIQKSLHEQIDVIRKSFVGQSHILHGQLETLSLQFGKPIMEALTPALHVATDAFGNLIGYFDKHPQVTKFVAAVALGGSVFMIVAGSILLVSSALGGLRLALSVANITFGALIGTTGAYLIAGLAVIGLGYLIYKNFDTLKQIWNDYGGIVKGVAALFLVAYTPAILVATGQMVQLAFVTGMTTLKTIAFNVATGIGAFFMGAYRSVMLAVTAAQWIYSIATGVATASTWLQYAAMIILAPTIAMIRLAVMAWTGAQWLLNIALDANPIGAVILLVVGLIGVVGLIIYKWNDWWTALKNFAGNLPGWAVIVLDVFMPIIGIPITIAKYWDKAIAKVKEFLHIKSKATTEEPPKIPDAQMKVNPVFEQSDILKQVQSIPGMDLKLNPTLNQDELKKQLESFNQVLPNGEKEGGGIQIPANLDLNEITKQMSALPEQMNTTGQNSGLELAKGLTGADPKITESLTGISNQFTSNLPKSEEMNQYGQNLGKSLADGMASQEEKVREASQKLATAIHANLGVQSPTKEGPLRTNHLWGGNLAKSFAVGMIKNLDWIERASNVVANAVQLPQKTDESDLKGRYAIGTAVRPRESAINSNEDGGISSRGLVIQGPLIGAIHQQPGQDGKALAKEIFVEVKRLFAQEGITNTLSMPGYGLGLGRSGY